ncbi:signal transducing adapter molecule 2-like isoform X2 [Sycon ciliatum]|uniref:signal transducing adapter molecule 2-like isoform X2 n=1 Tax=Sycon ciliatum TaxID=27933 RepID=UPI0031F6D00C
MPSGSRELEDDIQTATGGCWTPEQHDWDLIFDICSRVTNTPSLAKPAYQAIQKRMRSSAAIVQFSSLVVLEALVASGGRQFQLEISSRPFYDLCVSLYRKRPHQNVVERLGMLIMEWVTVFASDSGMGMIQKLYQDLKTEGFPFPSSPSLTSSTNTSTRSTSTPPVTSSASARKEDEDLSRAIALSLQDASTSSGTASSSQFPAATSSSLYPTLGSAPASAPAPVQSAPQQLGFQARALYDFQSEDDNEISFKAGELVNVTDSSDENWWSGSTLAGSGMFPASFVTRDLTVTPEPEIPAQKTSSGSSTAKTSTQAAKPKPEIREAQIELLLDMLHNADATVANEEEDRTLKELENECNDMKPLIAEKISVIDRERQALQDLNQQFQDALAYYQQLMKESAYNQPQSHGESAPQAPTYSEDYGQPIPVPQQQHPAAAPAYQASPPVTGGYYANSPAKYQEAPQPASTQYQQPQMYAYQQAAPQQQPPPPQQMPAQHPQQQQQHFPQDPGVYAHPHGQVPTGGHPGQQPQQQQQQHAMQQQQPPPAQYHNMPPAQVMPDGSLL